MCREPRAYPCSSMGYAPALAPSCPGTARWLASDAPSRLWAVSGLPDWSPIREIGEIDDPTSAETEEAQQGSTANIRYLITTDHLPA